MDEQQFIGGKKDYHYVPPKELDWENKVSAHCNMGCLSGCDCPLAWLSEYY